MQPRHAAPGSAGAERSAGEPGRDGLELGTYVDVPGGRLALQRRLADGAPRAVIQILHGMGEYAGRYAATADALARGGYATYVHDQRGHGDSRAEGEPPVHLADDSGFDRVLDDAAVVTDLIAATHPGLPIVLLGHSMGSFEARCLAARDTGAYAGLVLSGTGGSRGRAGRAGLMLARTEVAVRGPRASGALLDKLAFGGFSRAVHDGPGAPRTRFDWLSRDEAEVDAYLADPACGAIGTAGFFRDLLSGIERAAAPRAFRLAPDVPVLLISGEDDPVGGPVTGVQETDEGYRAAGVRDVRTIIYPHARHELFHELNRDEVWTDLVAWLDRRFGPAAP